MRDKQEKFNKLLDGKKPKSIDFSDKKDKPISTMSSLIDSTMAEREKDLSTITSKYNNKDVEKWLQNGGKMQLQTSNIEIKNEIKGILKPIELEKEGKKRVTFVVSEKMSEENPIKSETTSFFSRLKQRSNSSDRELLKQIIDNQKKLMEKQQEILKRLDKSDTRFSTTNN